MNKIKREKIEMSYDEIQSLWNQIYHGSEGEVNGIVYEKLQVINTSEFSDGPSWEYYVRRKSDGKYFKFDVWDAGYHNGYIFSDEENDLTEVFAEVTTVTKTVYK